MLGYNEKKVEKNMDLIFKHPIFDLAREKVKRAMSSSKNHRRALKACCTLISNVGAARYFSLQNNSGLLVRELLYSTSAKVATISGGMDDTFLGYEG